MLDIDRIIGSDLGSCTCSHAEENAIVQAAYNGVSTKGSTLYTILSPCLLCTKMIINAGINEIYYNQQYRELNTNEKSSYRLLTEAGVNLERINVTI